MNKIKELRESKGITQSDLASILGYSRTMVTKWETGKLEPTYGQKIDICNALAVPVEYLDISNKLLTVRNKYTRELTYRNRSLAIASIEDAFYLLSCLIIVIVNNYVGIPYFALILSILLSIGIVGTITIPFLFLKNIKSIKNDNRMKKWYIKNETSKFHLKEVISKNALDQEFDSLLLNSTEDK